MSEDNEHDILDLTAGLVGIMEGSQRKPVDREKLYIQLLKIDRISEDLGHPTKAKRIRQRDTRNQSSGR